MEAICSFETSVDIQRTTHACFAGLGLPFVALPVVCLTLQAVYPKMLSPFLFSRRIRVMAGVMVLSPGYSRWELPLSRISGRNVARSDRIFH
jgi:hypothetical protein